MQHIKHLQKDKVLAPLLKAVPAFLLEPKKHVYLSLCSSIMSQQLSVRVAEVLYQRFLALYGKKTPTVKMIAATPHEQLRGIGLSNAKAQYVLNVCNYFIEQRITDKTFEKLNDEEVIEVLVKIKGVGRWTAEMILMFSLAREDVFSVDDLGIQQAIQHLYGLNASDKKTLKLAMLQTAEQWKPYRTYACRYLWRWKDRN